MSSGELPDLNDGQPVAGPLRTDVLVIGSGAGGAVAAATIAASGTAVLIVEEGPNLDTGRITSNSPAAVSTLYRNGGLTPIVGNQTIAFVEGRCVGGSTEINSGFWHRLPADCYDRWSTEFLLTDFSAETMEPLFTRIESALTPSLADDGNVPKSSLRFRDGVEKLGWKYKEVPRCIEGGGVANPFAPGAKQSMQRTYLPRALAAGAQLLSNCKALRLLHRDGRVHGLRAEISYAGRSTPIEIHADAVFVCCGPIQTPALLRRSAIRRNVGNSLCIHPMIKAAALFDDEIDAHESALPIYQVSEFWPTITLGGAVCTPGFLGMLLADNWRLNSSAMHDWRRMAIFYAATRGMNRGTIRVVPGTADGVLVRYSLSAADRQNLSVGLARLGEALFAAGAKAVYPSLASHSILRSVDECRSFLKNPIPVADMALSTVHAFSSCPMGENPDRCPADSFGKMHGFSNLYVADASLIPDSPGVNPQGATMAIALRNAERFAEKSRRAAQRRSLRNGATKPVDVLVAGAPGWLGSRFVELLAEPVGVAQGWWPRSAPVRIRCLVQPGADWSALAELDDVEIVPGDLADTASLRGFFAAADGAVLFHAAGVVHPHRRTETFEQVNVLGTGNLLALAEETGIRRIVAVSSNSAAGCNPSPEHVFDESSPNNPYMGYGRSKVRMEELLAAAHARGRLEVAVLRPTWFYGPHQPARQTLFFRMIKEGRFPLLGDGEQKRSLAYVDDICQAMLLAATVPQANGQTYWVADERPYSMNEIVETVRAVLEQEFGIRCASRQLRLPSFVADVAEQADALLQRFGWYQQKIHVLGEMNKTIACSVDKAKRELGFAPRFGLRAGMTASIRWALANGQYI